MSGTKMAALKNGGGPTINNFRGKRSHAALYGINILLPSNKYL